MELELKITCTCHLAKITICCQTPLVLQKIEQGGFELAESKFAL